MSELHPSTKVMLDRYPKSVFEFGCGEGRNLQLLKDRRGNDIEERERKFNLFGIDINPNAIKKGQDNELNVLVGDESYLNKIKTDSFDIALCYSVLNHIPGDITSIIKNLKRISKYVILYEIIDVRGSNQFYHDYVALGFTMRRFKNLETYAVFDYIRGEA